MTKKELVAAVAQQAGINQKQAAAAIAAFTGEIAGALKKGEKVQLIGFGTFEVRERSARTCRNPQTGKAVKVAACKVPAFKAGKALKETVNTKKKKK